MTVAEPQPSLLFSLVMTCFSVPSDGVTVQPPLFTSEGRRRLGMEQSPCAHEGCALDVDEGDLSGVASSKLGKTAVPGCRGRAAPLGSCTSTPRMWGWTDILNVWESSLSVFPTHVGSPRLGGCESPGSRE